MTENEWVFYLSLAIFAIVAVGYLVSRVWIEIKKMQIKRKIKKEAYEKE